MTAATAERSFEHFRQPKSPGLGGLGKIGTGLLIGSAVVGVILTIEVNLIAGIVWGAVTGLVLLMIAVRDRHGESILERTAKRTAHARAIRTGTAAYRSGPLTRLGTYRLPGVLADTELTEWEDTTGEPFALVHSPRSRHYAVTIECHPDGALLVDNDDTAAQVDRWGDLLSFLAFEPGLVQMMVTIQTGPDDGNGLRVETGRTDPGVPALARTVMAEVMDTYPADSSAVRSWVTLTFAAADGKVTRSAEQMGAALAHRLPPIVAQLAATGAGQAAPVDGQGVCRIIRTAYDPAAARYLTGPDPAVLLWSGVGPVAASAAPWTYYRHSDAVSVSWSMTDVMGRVHADGLGPLLHPHPGIARKRVSLIYTPHDPGKSERIASTDVRAAEYRITATRKPSAADRKALASAEATAAEEAHGHALVDLAVIVTATVDGPEDLPAADAALDSIGPASRLLLRREDGGHAQAFVQGLPCVGLVAAAHALTPKALREDL